MSGNNALKQPFVQSIQQWGQSLTAQQIEKIGQSLPCSVAAVDGAIITVNLLLQDLFPLPMVTVPIAESIYVRLPIQVGDLGFTVAATAYLGGVSGLGGGSAGPWQPSNLGAMVFVPLGNMNWAAAIDPDAVQIQGPNGFILLNGDATYKITANSDGITIDMPGNGALIVNGLPTSDPHVVNQLWNNMGGMAISAG